MVTFSEDLASVTDLTNTAFTVKKTPSGGTEANQTLSGTPTVSGKTVTLTLSSGVVASDAGTVKVSYTAPNAANAKLRDAANNAVANFIDQKVVNLKGGICPRTEEVRDAILSEISGVNYCDDVTGTQLAGITGNTNSLNLSSMNIETLKSGDFIGLTNLRILDLSSNDLESLPEDLFDGLTGLWNLYLDYNSLTSLPEDLFDELTKLTGLRLTGNSLTSLHAELFDGLAELVSLSIDYNSLTSLHADLFDGLTKLVTLTAEFNSLTSIPDNLFDGLTKLEFLWLNDNSLTSLPADLFDEPTELKQLHLGGNSLNSLPTDLLDSLTKLERFHVDDNSLMSVPADLFDGLNKLKGLSFSSNAIANLSGDLLDGLTKLESLTLANNSLTTLHEDLFDDIEVDIDVWLNGNLITCIPDKIRENTLVTIHPSSIDVACPDPAVTLSTNPSSIGEEDEATDVTVTATMNIAQLTATPVTVSVGSGTATSGTDFTAVSDFSITIAANKTSATGTFTMTPTSDTVDEPGETVKITGTTTVSDVTVTGTNLTITDDDAAPTVTLSLSSASISENAASTTVTATLNHASSEATTVTVSAEPNAPATGSDYEFSTNTTLTIEAGATTSTGTVTITSVNNDVDTPDKTVKVKGTATNTQGVTAPTDVTLTIKDDEAAPTAKLVLMSSQIGENAKISTVTASLDRASGAATTITVSVDPVSPATSSDYTLSTNKVLTIAAGATTSTGTVTITSVNNDVDAPDKTMTVKGAATNAHGVTNPDNVTLKITDDDVAPTATLVLMPSSISEHAKVSMVTATLNHPSSEATTITVSVDPVSPTTSSDYTLSTNKVLTIAAGATTSAGTVTITSVNNDVDSPNKAVTVKGGAANTQGITSPSDVTLAITDDEATPTVTLSLSSNSIGEDAKSTTVTATLNHPSSEATAITVSVDPVSPATSSDYTLSANKILTIAAGATTSTGTVTITSVNNDTDSPNKTFKVKGTATNTQGITQPGDVELTITDDEAAPTVTLALSSSSIGEDGESTTVTATLDRASSAVTKITVSADPDAPTTTSDYTLSANKVLTIAAGATTSTGTVTITAVNNQVDAPNKSVTVEGTATNTQGITQPGDVELTITDDEAMPTVTLVLSPSVIGEAGEITTVTATLNRASSAVTSITVSAQPDAPAVTSDYSLSTNTTLTITAGETTSTGVVTITAVDNDVDAPDKTVQVQGTATNTQGVTEPDDVALTITDGTPSPSVTLLLSMATVSESTGSTTVTAALDRVSSAATTITISASPTSPATTSDYTLSTNKVLTIAAGATTSTGTVTITAVNNQVDAPNKSVTVEGTATNTQGITQPGDVELTITDDEAAPTVTLALSPTSISENAGRTTVTATLNRASSEATTITISALPDAPAIVSDLSLSGNTILTIAAGETASTGVMTITAVDNEVDAPNKTVQVQGVATNSLGVTQPAAVQLTITDDDLVPTVTLTLSSNSISENAGQTTVTASLNRASSAETTITVSVEATPPATASDYTLSSNTTLTIAAGATTSTGVITITAVDNQVIAQEKTVQVQGIATNSQGVGGPSAVQLTITNDDLTPTVTLSVSPASISENAGQTTVTATINHPSTAVTTVTVSVLPEPPATESDYTLSGNTILTIAAGATTSTGIVTITAVDNEVDAPGKTVQVQGAATNIQGITGPAAVRLSISDDELTPTATLALDPVSISENGGRTTVTATLDRPSSAETTITVSVAATSPAMASDYTLSSNTTLTIAAGATASTGVVTITAVDNQVIAPEKTVQVQGIATNSQGVIGPAAVQLTITNDDLTPTVTLSVSPASISENAGQTTVTATINHPSSAVTTITVLVLPEPPATESDYTLSENTILTIAAGETTSMGVVTITAVDNQVHAPDKTVNVKGMASNEQGSIDPADVELTITDDEVAPTVTLALDPVAISENGGRTTVTATLDRPSSAITTVTVSVAATLPATNSDYTLSQNTILTIDAGETKSTGLVTITAVDNEVDAPDKTVRAQGAVTNTQGMNVPEEVLLTITDDDEVVPVVTLVLTPASISENAGQTTVTATINHPSTAVTTITVSVLPEPPATDSDYTLSINTILTIAAGATTSTGMVTITAVDNQVHAPDKTVQVKGTASNEQGSIDPADVELTITDDEVMPSVTLVLDPVAIVEKGGVTTVTATLNLASSAVTTITVTALANSPATASDLILSDNSILTIAAGNTVSTGLVTIKSVDNEVDAPDKTVQVQGMATNLQGVTGPAAVVLTLTDDEESPPVARDVTVTTEEDTPYQFGISDFGYSDPEGDPMAAIRIERHPDAGTLTLDGTEFPAGAQVSTVRIAAGELIFTPVANAYGPAYTNFDFKVSNGMSESELAATMTIDVTPTNDVTTGRPQIMGSMQVGQELHVSVEEILDMDGMRRARALEPGYAYRYQWLRVGQIEPIAEASTYVPVETDAGTSLVVRVAFVDDAGFEETLESPPRQVRDTNRIRTAWMGRLGRTVADQILQATQCDGRVRQTRRSEAYLAGQPLTLASLTNYVRLQEVKPDHLSSLLGNSDQTYRIGHTLTWERLLSGSSFQHGIQDGRGIAIWGRGAISRFQGADGALNLKGRVLSGMLGADWVGDKGSLGVLVTQTRSEGEYPVATGEGDISGHLVGVYPNGCYAITSGLTAWAVAGYGRGSMTVEQVRGPADLQMIGGGIYGRIRTVSKRGLELGIRSDALMVQMSASATEELPDARAQVTRLRLGLQGTMRGIHLGTRSTIEPVAELALRHDGGDAETGFGVDLRVGVVFSAPASGLSVEVITRTVLTHQDRRFQEQGLSGVVIWDARPQSSEGLQIRLEQTVGAVGKTEELLNTETIQPRYSVHSTDFQTADLRLHADYGFALFSDEVILQPEVSVSGWGPQSRYEMGWNLSRAHERPTNVQLFVGATGHAPRGDGPLQFQHLIRLQLKRLF